MSMNRSFVDVSWMLQIYIGAVKYYFTLYTFKQVSPSWNNWTRYIFELPLCQSKIVPYILWALWSRISLSTSAWHKGGPRGGSRLHATPTGKVTIRIYFLYHVFNCYALDVGATCLMSMLHNIFFLGRIVTMLYYATQIMV